MTKKILNSKLKKINISKKEFAEKCHIPYPTVLNWGTGKNPIPPYVENLIDGIFFQEKFKKMTDIFQELEKNFQELEKSFENFRRVLK